MDIKDLLEVKTAQELKHALLVEILMAICNYKITNEEGQKILDNLTKILGE